MRVECYDLHIYCDNPDCELGGVRGGPWEYAESTKQIAYKEARSDGWKLGKKDICPNCTSAQTGRDQ